MTKATYKRTINRAYNSEGLASMVVEQGCVRGIAVELSSQTVSRKQRVYYTEDG